jgi:leucyl-tRNA synthetase
VVLLLNPITPHTSHALWQALGHPEQTLEDLRFPVADPDALVRDAVTLAVQVNGKLRATLDVAVNAGKDTIEALALAFERGDITLPPVQWLIDELLSYEQERMPSGAMRYGAPPGGHDDGVMALAIAWHAMELPDAAPHGIQVASL